MSTVILSVGHQPKKPGACWDGVSEYGLSQRIVERIDHPDILVIDDVLTSTVKSINMLDDVALAAELHWNSSASGNAVGCETLYCPGSYAGREAAQRFQAAYMANAATRDRGIKEGWYRMQKNGSIDYFLKATRCPSIILEPEFIQIAAHWEDYDIEQAAIYLQVALLHARG